MTQRPQSRLYLVTPLLDDIASFAPALEQALGGGDIAAVLLRLNESGERILVERAKAIAAIVHRRDIALLIDGRPEMVGRMGADGAHLTGIDALLAAIGGLKPDRIAGVGGLRSRHDAMLAGETAADYVMFGEPGTPGGRNRQGDEDDRVGPPLEAVLERVAWWAELFQPPCIGYAGAADTVGSIAQAGADFVALGEWIWTQEGGAEKAVAEASAKLAAASS